MRLIAIGGAPASGKTTLMRAVMKQYAPFWNRVKSRLLVWEEARQVAVLGIYDHDEPFAGTDRLSMAVQPQALKWLQQLHPTAYRAVLFEGDRLFNQSFLKAVLGIPKLELTVAALRCGEKALTARHKARGDTQTALWLKGRDSKVAGVFAAFPDQLLELEHRTPEDTQAAADQIVSLLKT